MSKDKFIKGKVDDSHHAGRHSEMMRQDASMVEEVLDIENPESEYFNRVIFDARIQSDQTRLGRIRDELAKIAGISK